MQEYSTIIGVIRMRLDGKTFPECEARYSIGSYTAQDIMKKFSALGISAEELETMTPSQVQSLFYPAAQRRHLKIPVPDFDSILNTLKRGQVKINRNDIWEEYHRQNPDGYKRTQLLQYYREYMIERFGPDKVTMAVNRIPGERVYIDWCGDKAKVHIEDLSKDFTEEQEIHLFLTTCGYSSKIYAEAALDEKQEQFNAATAHALIYYGCVPEYLVPDNLRTGVKTNTRDKVIINSSYKDLEDFFETTILPPPYYRPRGKATAERYVQVIERTVINALHRQYYFKDLNEVNQCVMRVVEEENAKVPRGYKQSHNELFEIYDKPAMRPLKDAGFINCDYSYCPKVMNNYHVYYDNHYYSVPYHWCGKEVIVKASRDLIRICDINNRLVSEHKRSYIPTIRYITKEEHMPANHRFYSEVNSRDSAYYLNWAEDIGNNMRQLVYMILKSADHDEQMYRTCNSIFHMCEGVPKGICEDAAADCIRRRKANYSEFREVLSDLIANRKQIKTASLPEIQEVRGKGYYE